MAHHLARADKEDGEQPPASSESANTTPPVPFRSSPIAIRKENTSRRHAHADTSDEEESSSSNGDDTVQADAVRLGASLPSRLLRAPFLGARPSNEDYIAYDSMLPPAMALTTAASDGAQDGPSSSGAAPMMGATTTTSYGSLRDSHRRGRFLDGPSSYRDRATGDIIMGRRQRFGGEASMASSAPALSIGDRIRQSRQRQVQAAAVADNNTASSDDVPRERTSSLTAMLSGESAPTEDATNEMERFSLGAPFQDGAPNKNDDDFVAPAHSTLYDHDQMELDSSNMLSTSLTGLEVLQRQQVLARLDRVDERSESSQQLYEQHEQLPRDAQGHNALLSRSFSDPTPHGALRNNAAANVRHSPPPTSATTRYLLPPAGTIQQQQQSNPIQPVSFLSASMESEPDGGTRTNVQQQPQAEEQLPHSQHSHNPDTEGAFDMDME